jgi:hypothetical protein
VGGSSRVLGWTKRFGRGLQVDVDVMEFDSDADLGMEDITEWSPSIADDSSIEWRVEFGGSAGQLDHWAQRSDRQKHKAACGRREERGESFRITLTNAGSGFSLGWPTTSISVRYLAAALFF